MDKVVSEGNNLKLQIFGLLVFNGQVEFLGSFWCFFFIYYETDVDGDT